MYKTDASVTVLAAVLGCQVFFTCSVFSTELKISEGMMEGQSLNTAHVTFPGPVHRLTVSQKLVR
jgi:hypothetical protein